RDLISLLLIRSTIMISAARSSGRNGPSSAATAAPPGMPHTNPNVGEMERVASIAGGAALLTGGILRGSWSGALLALFGGGLLYRGLSGHCELYRALGISTSECPAQRAVSRMRGNVEREAQAGLDAGDPVEEASYESFPASDP